MVESDILLCEIFPTTSFLKENIFCDIYDIFSNISGRK